MLIESKKYQKVLKEEIEKREEVERLDRIKNRDTQISNHYEMMHQRLVGN